MTKPQILFSEVPIIPIVPMDEVQPEHQYVVVIQCTDCKAELNRSCAMSGAEVKERWLQLCLTAPLNTGKCPNGCRATYSDCNLNTDMNIMEHK